MAIVAALAGCGQAGGEDLAALRATVAAQASAMTALQLRIDELDAALKEERAERVRALERLRGAAQQAAAESPSVMPSCADDGCVLKRDEVEVLLADPASLARLVRLVPAQKDGQTIGFKLYAIRPNTLLARLGLKNGDTIRSIAGIELDSVEKAMTLPESLRKLDRWTIAGVRKDMPFELVIEVR